MAAEKRTSEIGKPFAVKASPQAPEHLPSELKKLWTLCMELKVPWEFDVREVSAHGGHSKYRESARIHHRIVVDTVDSALAALRTEGCSKLFLGGRDVWTFAVCCARRRIPFLFIPELSRYVTSKLQIRQFLESRGFRGDELFLDTGFAGSIPRNLQRHWPGFNFRFRLMSQSDVAVVHQEAGLVDCDPAKENKPRKAVVERWRRRPQQLFPNRAKAREEALETEYLAKYWKTGTYELELPITVWTPKEAFEQWSTREGVFKFVYRKQEHVYLCDGKEVAEVSLHDAQRLEPRLVAWAATLEQRETPEEHVSQFFSDRRSIQRAALLTSMLWRGIPFWKAAMSREEKRQAQQWTGAVYNTAGITNLNITSNSAVNYTIGTNTLTGSNIYTVQDFGFNQINQITSSTWPPTSSAATTTGTGATSAAYLAAAASQLVGKPLNAATQNKIATLAAMMAKADQAMYYTGPKAIPAPLPPSQPLPSQLPPAPIKPDPVIVLQPTLAEIDAGWDVALA